MYLWFIGKPKVNLTFWPEIGTAILGGKKKEVQEYKEADDAGKDAILEAYREELMKAAHQTVRKAQVKIAGKSTRELERLKFLETQKYNFVNGNTRANARIKFVAIADPSRSSAGPLG